MSVTERVKLNVHLSLSVHAYWEPEDSPDDWVPCCYGSAHNGPRGCTCWEPVYDQEQSAACGDVSNSPRRDSLCHDCAYRPGSPERQDPDSAENLLSLPEAGTPFYCHQGMRKILRWEHPSGRVYVPTGDDYKPGFTRDYIPLKADGTPADLCEGWRRRLVRLGRQAGGVRTEVSA